MNSEKPKLFLLDGYALVYRAYYAFIKSPRINSKGENTSAIYGFINTLEEILKKENPTHIAVAFDPKGGTFRHEAYQAYKAQREETPEDIRLAIPKIKELLEAYRIPILEIAGFEADDVIGTMAKKAKERGYTTYMMTPDKDFGQLVEPDIYQYKPKLGFSEQQTLGVDEICQKFEISHPLQVIDILGLMGDSSDNIPGCPGVGEVTAKKLIKEFGSIESLLSHTEQLKGALKGKIENNREQIMFSKFLATIRIDVPVDFNEEALIREEPNSQKLSELFGQLEFRGFTAAGGQKQKPNPTPPVAVDLFNFAATTEDKASENLKSLDIGTGGLEFSPLKSLKSTQYSYYMLDSDESIADFVAEFMCCQKFAFDTETTSIEATEAQLVGMSFCKEKNRAYWLPIPQEKEKAARVIDKIKPLLSNDQIHKIGQNLKYDLLVLSNYGIQVQGEKMDTMIAHYLIQPELRHSMDYLAEVYLSYETIKIEELIGARGKSQKKMSDLPPEQIKDYAAEDADITWQLWEILEEELEQASLTALFREVEMPLMEVLVEMERQGVEIDLEALQSSSTTLTAELNRLEQQIQEMAGEPFNVNSPKQIGEILFDKLNISGKAKKTKTGQYSTNEEILESYRSKHPIIGLILQHRGLKKLLSTYIDALPLLINSRTGKIHTSYNQSVTATGRLSSSNPNLQNIPIRDEQGREIRKAFVSSEGSLFFSADYSQIELRIMAHLSQDANMIEAFNSGEDIHAATAAKIYKVPIEQVTREMRSRAKTANFGIIYGISVFGLSERLAIPRAEAKELIDGYFEIYPGVKQYMELSIQQAKERGYVETILGRKRYLSDINSRNANVRGYAERNAINAPIQGSAADIIKIAMIRIQKQLDELSLRTKMTLQVHDELNFNMPIEEQDIARKIIIETMESAYKMSVPLRADFGIGKSWFEAH